MRIRLWRNPKNRVCFVCEYSREQHKDYIENLLSAAHRSGSDEDMLEYEGERWNLRAIHFHHRSYEHLGSAEEEKDLVPLCDECHWILHTICEFYPDAIKKPEEISHEKVAFRDLHLILKASPNLRKIFD